MQVSYLTMGLNRGTPRLWLEGRRLGKAGFEPGARYRIEANTDDWSLRLVLDPAGNRRVSGKKRGTTPLPIIDLCDAGLAPAGTRVRAVIERGVITITIHHEAMNRHTREAAIAAVARGERPLREATICVGIGISTAALHQGLEESGVDAKVDWIVDVEGRYLDMADRNAACITDDTRLFQAAVEEVEPDLVTPVDLLSMSLPCTNHSKAGRSKRGIKVAEEGADAATCLFGAVALIRASNPALVTSENVLEARASTMYLLLQHELMRLGYHLFEAEVDERQAGSVERRSRWIFVAVSQGLVGEDFDLAAVLPAYPRQYRCIGELLEPMPDADPAWTTRGYLDAKQERDIAAGKGFRRQLVTPTDESYGTIGRGYQKARSSEPFLTREDGLERLFTPIEHARGKGIPEHLAAGESKTVAHEGLGQSVLWNHFRGLGVVLGRLILGKSQRTAAGLASVAGSGMNAPGLIATLVVSEAASDDEQLSLAL